MCKIYGLQDRSGLGSDQRGVGSDEKSSIQSRSVAPMMGFIHYHTHYYRRFTKLEAQILLRGPIANAGGMNAL